MKMPIVLFFGCLAALSSCARADENPSEVVQAAIKAHGGEQNIAKTLTGKLYAKAKISMPATAKTPAIESTSPIEWDEIFEIPRRFKRTITGEINGERGFMEFVRSDEGGWIRRNDVPDRDIPANKTPREATWHAAVAMLPTLLGKDYKLDLLNKQMVDDHEAIVLHAKRSQFETVCFFDAKTYLLLKCKHKLAHPLFGKDTDCEVLYGEYKDISGMKYPMKVTLYIEGKKALELEITKIEFSEKLDDKLFAKP